MQMRRRFIPTMHDPNLIVTKTDSGISVVTTPEKAQEALRAKRRARKTVRRRKAAERLSAAQKGKTAWRAKAKWLHKTHFSEDHNF